jgi:hypothetical protein
MTSWQAESSESSTVAQMHEACPKKSHSRCRSHWPPFVVSSEGIATRDHDGPGPTFFASMHEVPVTIGRMDEKTMCL